LFLFGYKLDKGSTDLLYQWGAGALPQLVFPQHIHICGTTISVGVPREPGFSRCGVMWGHQRLAFVCAAWTGELKPNDCNGSCVWEKQWFLKHSGFQRVVKQIDNVLQGMLMAGMGNVSTFVDLSLPQIIPMPILFSGIRDQQQL
jgi:hypothetical protein